MPGEKVLKTRGRKRPSAVTRCQERFRAMIRMEVAEEEMRSVTMISLLSFFLTN